MSFTSWRCSMRNAVMVMLVVLFVAACESTDPQGRSSADATPSEPASASAERVELSISAEAEQAAEDVDVELRAVVDDAIARVREELDLPPTVVRVQVEPERAIPDIGVGGFTSPSDGSVTISLDPSFPDFERTLTEFVPLTVAHELHHSARILDGPGYGVTLQEALVTEGLADAFSLQVWPQADKPPWVEALPSGSVCRWWQRASSMFNKDSYDHGVWFFGEGDVPHWTGYTLGFELVQKYLDKHPGETAADLADVDADRIVEGSEFCR